MMLDIDGWDWALLAVAGYVALVSLARLMQTHRAVVLRQWQERIEQETRRMSRQRHGEASHRSRSPSAEDGHKTDAA
jgi:hypothetical protein